MQENRDEPLISKSSNPKKTYFMLFLIVFLQTALLLFHMHRKVGFHIDELWSYSFANSLENSSLNLLLKLSWPYSPIGNLDSKFSMVDLSNNFNNKWTTGKFFNEYLTVQPNERFSYLKVMEHKTFDSHPPIYDWILHTICSFFPDSFSKWYGLSINFVSFILSQFLLFKISRKLFSEKIALLCAFFYGFSAASVNTFIFIRSYGLMVFLFLLTTHLFLKTFDSSNLPFSAISISLIIAIGALTHYFYMIYAFYIATVFDIICLLKKKYKLFWWVSLASILGIILAYLVFPEGFHVLTSSKMSQVVRNDLNLISIIWQNRIWWIILYYFIGFNYSISVILSPFLNLIFAICLIICLISLIITPIIKRKNATFNFTKMSCFIKISEYFQKINPYLLLFFMPIYLFFATIVRMVKPDLSVSFNNRYFLPGLPYIAVGIVILFYTLINSNFFTKVKKKEVFLYFAMMAFCISSQMLNLDFAFLDKEAGNIEVCSRTAFKEIFEDSNCILFTKIDLSIHELSIVLKDCKRVYNIRSFNQSEIPIKELKPAEKNIFVSSLPTEVAENIFYSKYNVKLKKILVGFNFFVEYNVFEIILE